MKRIVAIILAAVLLFGITGCAGTNNADNYVISEQREPLPVYKLSYNAIGGGDVMPLGGWWGPHEAYYPTVNGNNVPNYVSDEIFALLAECGMNMTSASPNDYVSESAREDLMKALDLSQKYGMGYIIQDARFVNATTVAEQMKNFADYLNHPALVGIHVRDEPKANQINQYVNTYKQWQAQQIEDKYIYINLFGYTWLDRSGIAGVEMSYEEYLRYFLDNTGAPLLSVDTYPFNYANQGNDNFYAYFAEMSTLRKISMEYGVPFQVCIQTGGQFSDAGEPFASEEYYPNEGEFLWNLNINLAYGCKGFIYFCAIQPYHYSYEMDDQRDFNRLGFLGAAGNKNRWWFYAKKANAQIAAVDHVLMNATNIGVIPVGDKANSLVTGEEKVFSCRELTSASGNNTVIGCFDYHGKTAFYVVNNSTVDSDTVQMNFDNNYGYEVIQRTESRLETGKTLTLELGAGEGVLVVLQ